MSKRRIYSRNFKEVLQFFPTAEVYVTGSKRQHGFGNDGGGGDIDDVELVNVLKTEYQYEYNGQEWQDELGLNMYAMDMRQYDPAIARWVVQDPVIHHDFSPYSAFDNNPVFWADPSGADAVYNWDKKRYEDSNGNEVSFETAMASVGLNSDGTEKGDGEQKTSLDNSDEKERKSIRNNRYFENCPKCWWLNNDEYLTPDEAIWHYRLGNGEPVNVRLNKLDLSKVSVKDFENTPYSHQNYPMIYVNFDQGFYTNFDQAIIYGTIALVYLGNNTVMALPDTYDFDLKYNYSTLKGVIRDIGTLVGLYWNGVGTPYDIQFLGTAKIKE